MMTGLAYFGCPYAARTHFSYDFVGSSPQLTDGKTDYCFPQRFVDITRVLFPTPRLRRRVKGECRLLHFQINHITMPPQTRALLFAMNSSIFFSVFASTSNAAALHRLSSGSAASLIATYDGTMVDPPLHRLYPRVQEHHTAVCVVLLIHDT